MNKPIKSPVPDEQVFILEDRITLEDVRAECEASLQGTALRDTRSAFRALADRGGVDLAATLARPQEVREIFARLTPAHLGVSDKRLANLRSSIASAVALHGMQRTWITRQIPPSPAWERLLVGAPEQCRWGLGRLACYCTVKGIPPDDVTPETLLGLHAALEAEAMSKDPRNLLKHTIALWNMGGRSVPGWPDVVLSSPFERAPFLLPLAAFPEVFQREGAAVEARMSTADPLDPHAPVRPLRPATIDSYRLALRRAASALVRDGLAIEEVEGLRLLFEPDNFVEALRPFLPKEEGGDSGSVHKMARQLLTVARHDLRLDETTLAPLEEIAARLKPCNTGGMGARNRERLAQFDDEAVLQRLLRFPEEERARALRLNNPQRRAKGIERALAIALLLGTGMRAKNLRQLRFDRNFRRAGSRLFLQLRQGETKTHADLELELPAEVIALLDEFLAEHRPQLPRADTPWLFAGATGDARSYSAMRDAVAKPLWKHAGIRISPHLFRHVIAKVVAERAPELLHHVSRMLGHRSMRTTYSAYLGTEGPAAARRVAELLRQARRKSEESDR